MTKARPLLVTRPLPAGERTAAAARAMGLEAVVAPLLRIAPRGWTVPAGDFDAVLLTSANALAGVGADVRALAALPAYAVGEATAAAARAAGFARVAAGAADGAAALRQAADDRRQRVLWIAGETRSTLAAPAGVAVTAVATYNAELLALDDVGAAALRRGAAAALFSARTAAHFAREAARLSFARADVPVAALSATVADAAGHGWGAVGVPEAPTEAALLAVARRLCQEGE